MNSSQFIFFLSSMVQGKTTESCKVLNKIFLLAAFNGKRALHQNESNSLSQASPLTVLLFAAYPQPLSGPQTRSKKKHLQSAQLLSMKHHKNP